MTNLIYGGAIIKAVKARCTQKKYFVGKTVSIIRFKAPPEQVDPVQLAYYKAATTSTEQKSKTFQFLGCFVEQPYLSSNTSTEEIKSLINTTLDNPNLIGIIVQNPIPRKLKSKITKQIPSTLDLDGVTPNHPLFQASATSVAIARLVSSFANIRSRVAVVGGKGFVGAGVIKILSAANINCLSLDYGDDLTRTNEADIVVSATGVPELLDSRHINSEHKLVVDSGFIPLENKILGDVNREAYSIPQNITPVPGGVGPLQMAILLERIMSLANLPIQEWDYKKDILSQISLTPKVKPKLLNSPQFQLSQARELLSLGNKIYDETPLQSKTEVSPLVWEVRGDFYILKFDRNNMSFSISHKDRGLLLTADLKNKNNIQIHNAIAPLDVETFKSRLNSTSQTIKEQLPSPQKNRDKEL